MSHTPLHRGKRGRNTENTQKPKWWAQSPQSSFSASLFLQASYFLQTFVKVKEGREKRGSASFTFMSRQQQPGFRRLGDRSYPLIWCPPPSSLLSLLPFCCPRGDVALWEQAGPSQDAPCDHLFFSQWGPLNFPTDPWRNREAIILKLGKSDRKWRVKDWKGKESI